METTPLKKKESKPRQAFFALHTYSWLAEYLGYEKLSLTFLQYVLKYLDHEKYSLD